MSPEKSMKFSCLATETAHPEGRIRKQKKSERFGRIMKKHPF